MFCHKCGAKNDINDSFCQNCGAKLVFANKVKKQSTSKIVSDAGKKAVKLGAKGIKKGHSLVFKIGAFTSIFAIVIALLNFYFTYMISTPDGVVKNFFEASDNMDYKSMVACFDPTTQKLASTGGNLIMDFIGSATGFNIDFDTATTISSAFGSQMVTEENQCNASNFKVESITGEKYSAFIKKFGTKIQSIGNALGSTAVVSFEVDNKPTCVASSYSEDIPDNASRLKYEIEVKNYGKDGWKIPGNVTIRYVGYVE